MISAAADIGNVENRAVGDLPLNPERPLMCLWCLQIWVDHRIRGRLERCRLRQTGGVSRRRQRWQIRKTATALTEALVDHRDGGTGQVGQNLRREYERVDAVVGDPVIGADRSLARGEGIPRETD